MSVHGQTKPCVICGISGSHRHPDQYDAVIKAEVIFNGYGYNVEVLSNGQIMANRHEPGACSSIGIKQAYDVLDAIRRLAEPER